MELAKVSLVIKRQVLEEFTDKGLYPYSRYYLRNIKSSFDQYWRNHFSTIGIIGMNDALFNLFGFDITEDRGVEFSVKTLDFMRERLADFQEQTGSLFNLEATPAEGTSYRLADLDRQAYPDIKIYSQHHNGNGSSNGSSSSNGNGASTPAPYYTNSSQLPVGFTDDVFQALKLQDPLQSRYTGGTVLHCYVGEKLPSKAATIALVKTIAENFRLPYFTLTPTFSICGQHGYIAGEHSECPDCGDRCEVWSRSVGYLRPVDQWNKGKQVEYQDRRTYDRQLTTQKLESVH